MESETKLEKINNPEYDDQILTQKISDMVLGLKGVSRLTYSSITENVTKNVLKIDQTAQGVKLTRDDNVVNVNVHICVYYGQNIPQLSYDIQSKVKNLIEDLTGEEVKAVNISVDGIDRTRD